MLRIDLASSMFGFKDSHSIRRPGSNISDLLCSIPVQPWDSMWGQDSCQQTPACILSVKKSVHEGSILSILSTAPQVASHYIDSSADPICVSLGYRVQAWKEARKGVRYLTGKDWEERCPTGKQSQKGLGSLAQVQGQRRTCAFDACWMLPCECKFLKDFVSLRCSFFWVTALWIQ